MGRVGMLPNSKTIIQQRYEACKACEHFINLTKQCDKCFCFIPVKIMFNSASCPLDKWITVDNGLNGILRSEDKMNEENPFTDSE